MGTPFTAGAVKRAAQSVLDARAAHPQSNLAQLYGSLTMPADLRAAHTALDRTVDALYGLRTAATTEAGRLAALLSLYHQQTGVLLSVTASPPVRRGQTSKKRDYLSLVTGRKSPGSSSG